MKRHQVLGLIFAMPIEARCFSSSFSKIGEIYSFGQKTLVAVAGMGETSGTVAAALVQKGATALISCGSAVGLNPELKSGALCMPDALVNGNGQIYSCDQILREQVFNFLANVKICAKGNLFHTPNVLKTSKEKLSLYENFGAIAADMESFFIAREACQLQIPFLALRVILDEANFNMPDELSQCVSDGGEIHLARILLNVCKNPTFLFSLLMLARNFSKVRKILKQISQMKILIN
jgi:nucleoside phosphorylase